MFKKLVLVLVLAAQGVIACAQSLQDKLDEYMTANARIGKFNGVVLVAKDGKILLQKGYGWRDVSKHVAHDEHSIFQIGSITKQFTATVILYLQEKGKLNVQDKLSKFLPDFPNGDSISIAQLLSHTSGVYNYTRDGKFMNSEAIKSIALDSLIRVFKNKPLDFKPGTRFSYSNSGYILLGAVIQKVSGKPYEQMVREVIFRPAQMQHSGFDFKALKDIDKSTGYFAMTADTIPAKMVDSSVSFAAGAIYSTAKDLYMWNRSLFTERIVKQSSLKQAFTPVRDKYGFGWVMDTIKGKFVIMHNGGIFGFTSDMLRVPADSACIILLSNKPENLGPITRTIFNILYNEPYEIPHEKVTIKLPDTLLQQYVGEYEMTSNFTIVITLENGALKAQATNQPKLDIFAEKENVFFLKVVEAQLEFLRGTDGKVDRVVLNQNGIKQTAKKIK